MKTILFQPRFAALVVAGTKRQTVRPTRRYKLIIGEAISLRVWTGKPYRSPQKELLPTTIRAVSPVYISRGGVFIGKSAGDGEAFARADGFASFAALCDWFDATHGLPFTGIVIEW